MTGPAKDTLPNHKIMVSIIPAMLYIFLLNLITNDYMIKFFQSLIMGGLWIDEYFDKCFSECRKTYRAAKVQRWIISIDDSIRISRQISIITFLKAYRIWIAVIKSSRGLKYFVTASFLCGSSSASQRTMSCGSVERTVITGFTCKQAYISIIRRIYHTISASMKLIVFAA